MNKDKTITEILTRLKNNDFERDCNDGSCYKELYLSEIEILLDYITNLEKENKKLKEIERLNNIIKEAIEYIHNNYPVCAGKDLLDILEGEDNGDK